MKYVLRTSPQHKKDSCVPGDCYHNRFVGILPCPVTGASARFLVDGEHQAHAPRRWAKAYRTGVNCWRVERKRKGPASLVSDPSQEILTSATFSIHEKGCLVGGRSPSFKHASHETEHLTPRMSADSVHLCSCATAGHGARSWSGSHAPAQSVPSPRCGRPLASHVQAFISPAVALASFGQGFATAL